MTQKFQNKYRVDSTRLRGYDYRNEGAYFLTICTKDRNHYFGECADGKMQLSPIGKIAHRCWAEIPDHFPNASLGAFIIMPDHMHGIIILNYSPRIIPDEIISNGIIIPVQTLHATSPQISLESPQISPESQAISPESLPISQESQPIFLESPEPPTYPALPEPIELAKLPLQSITEILGIQSAKLPSAFYQKISPKAGGISAIIRSYKSAVSKCSRTENPKFQWQSLFHDHVIRNENEYERIRYYILNNPMKWKGHSKNPSQ
jgi:putative transposase